MPSAWNPFLYIWAAFDTIAAVKFVPGAKRPEKPEFVDRFLFWRRCALRVGCWSSLLWLLLSLNEFQAAWRNVRDKLEQFPEMIRPYFSRFIYAELACQSASEFASVLAVFIFMRAWKEQDNFERSSDLTKVGWFFNTMGPFLPYLLIPLSFFFRVDYFQRDVCASVIGMMAHDPISGMVFAEAAGQASEPDLSAALSNPMAKPPRFGEPGFDESPAAAWCWRYYHDWQQRLFSEKWMSGAMSDVGDGHNLEVPRVFGPTYPGVVPKALELLAGLFGAGHAMDASFCEEKEGVLTKANAAAVGSSGSAGDASFLEGWDSMSSSDPAITRLRQKIVQVYKNMTFHTPAEASYMHELVREATAASLSSFGELQGSFAWPRPDGFRAHRPGARRKFLRREAVLVDASGGIEEEEHAQVPDMSLMAGGLGKQAVCTLKALLIAAMKMCTFCYVLVQTAVSMYCAVGHSLPLAALILGVVDGMGFGVYNVKSILYRSCLPGYIMSITVFVTLPGILFILVFFSQVGGSPLLSLAMTCLAVWRALDFSIGELAVDLKNPKKLEKTMWRVECQKYMCLLAALGLFIAHFIHFVYAHSVRVNLDMSGAKDAIVKKIQQPSSLCVALLKFIYVRVFTTMVTTNWIMEAVFDAADDTLKVSKESGKHVEESWAKLTQNKRKKKKKKRKKDEETEEEGYEEGWYYEEGVGEVPDLPPAAPQGVEPSAAADPAAPAADPAVPAGEAVAEPAVEAATEPEADSAAPPATPAS